MHFELIHRSAVPVSGTNGNAFQPSKWLVLIRKSLAGFDRKLTLINEGELDGVRFLKRETVRLMTQTQTPSTLTYKRGLGWDINTGYSRPRGALFPVGLYGHTGFTGTTLWVDPSSKSFWILLTSRLHPSGAGNIMLLQRELGTLSAEAVETFTGNPFERLSVVEEK